ncbi:MAG: 16S rRNA (guanine(527)-N(7))-methyltransferase RsmG [Deltaproteobacteria bacterium]|nr:16S rRNA (guanine(527)-N(7))-methyltransferase RsmG [Deltaproteobacteria bacterium]
MSAASSSLTLGATEYQRLRAQASALGVTLDDVALERFGLYAQLLDRWGKTTNLISCRTADELIDRHLLDALICDWPCGRAHAIADLGSGAGLPGVPLAIVAPHRRTLLIEPRRRRASFLRAVKRDLGLDCVEVLSVRAETVGLVEPVDVAVCRAVWADDEVLRVAAPWIHEHGLLLCLRSEKHPRRAKARGDAFVLEQVLAYRIPGGAQRRIDVYRKGPSRPDECFT